MSGLAMSAVDSAMKAAVSSVVDIALNATEVEQPTRDAEALERSG